MQFKESLNTAVFTTRYVVEELSPILFVYHDDDGSWQFHGGEQEILDEDMRLVALEEIIKLDKSILELANMPIGFEAVRSDDQSSWKVISSN